MNIWEEAYSKNKEGVKPTAYQPNDHYKNSQPVKQPNSFKDIYYQNTGPQADAHHEIETGIKQSLSAQTKPPKNRFSPRETYNISHPYPAVLSKLHNHLSDIWANIMVETRQSLETLLVCGATRKEGNTFISFNLAMFLSKEYSMKVLYVDSNQNHEAIPKIKGLPGLYSSVSEKRSLSSLIVETEYPGFFLLPSGYGKSFENSRNVMTRESVEELMDFCRTNFEMTIIDGQPLTINPAMIEFAKAVDMTAIVCRYGYSRYEVSKQAIDKLHKFGISSIGIILNDRQFPVPPKIYKMMG